MTFSDRELERRIRAHERVLAQCKPGGWAAGKVREEIAALKAQLALPRDKRCQWQPGSI